MEKALIVIFEIACIAVILGALWRFTIGRKLNLIAREEVINGHIDGVLHGFIFCKHWRLSDLHYIAEELGVVLTMIDCFQIMKDLNEHFDKNHGINNQVIKEAILRHVARKEEINTH